MDQPIDQGLEHTQSSLIKGVTTKKEPFLKSRTIGQLQTFKQYATIQVCRPVDGVQGWQV